MIYSSAIKAKAIAGKIMKENLSRQWIGTGFVLLAVRFGTAICAQARLQCVADSLAATGQNFTSERYRFDVVPCSDGNQDRSKINNESHIKSTEEAISIIAWIVAKTGWTISGTPPMRFVPYAELVKIFSGGKPTDYHVESLYSEEDHTIYLPDSWRADDLHDRSILLHELVHHLQYLNDVKVTCASEYEWQAIKLQVAWLRDQDVDDPLDLLGINPRFLLMIRQCE